MTEETPAGDVPATTPSTGAHDPGSVMDLLAEHVPLALLADLAAPDGPVSQEILETEGLPDDAWWETEEGDPAPSDEPS